MRDLLSDLGILHKIRAEGANHDPQHDIGHDHRLTGEKGQGGQDGGAGEDQKDGEDDGVAVHLNRLVGSGEIRQQFDPMHHGHLGLAAQMSQTADVGGRDEYRFML